MTVVVVVVVQCFVPEPHKHLESIGESPIHFRVGHDAEADLHPQLIVSKINKCLEAAMVVIECVVLYALLRQSRNSV